MAKLAIQRGDVDGALVHFARFEKVWDMVSGNFVSIDLFPKTDDEDQPELYLRTQANNVYVGEWDPHSGYFFASEIVSGTHPLNHELPGRMYIPPVEFAYKVY